MFNRNHFSQPDQLIAAIDYYSGGRLQLPESGGRLRQQRPPRPGKG